MRYSNTSKLGFGARAGLLLLLLSGSGTVQAQTPAPPTAMPTKSVSVPSALQRAIASKPQVNLTVLQASVTLKGSTPLLRMSSTKSFALRSPTAPEPALPATLVARAKQMPARLAPFKQHIETPYFANQAPPVAVLDRPVVDYKSRQTPVRDQGDRNTCTAFAAVAGLEAYYMAQSTVTRDLSEQHVFRVFQANEGQQPCLDEGFVTWRTAEWLTQARTCTEAQQRYSGTVPPACNSVSDGECMRNRRYGFTSTEVILGRNYGGTEPLVANNTNYLESILASGHEIVFALEIAGTDWAGTASRMGVIDVQLNPQRTGPAHSIGSHALLMVGYNRPGGYFEFKNSWGTDLGRDGYFRVSYDYVQVYGKYGYYITGATEP